MSREDAWQSKAKALGRAALMELATVVTPETILRWYRNLIAAEYDGTAKRGPGRPRVDNEIPGLILKMARETPAWATQEYEDLCAILATKSVGARSSYLILDRDPQYSTALRNIRDPDLGDFGLAQFRRRGAILCQGKAYPSS